MIEEDEVFREFLARAEPRLRGALVARFGAVVGRAATVDALSYAWEHYDRLAVMASPVGYLFRVGQSAARRYSVRSGSWQLDADPGVLDEPLDVDLIEALAGLPGRQRMVVFMVHALGWTHREVGDLLGLSRSTVQTHLERGLAALRTALEVPHDTR